MMVFWVPPPVIAPWPGWGGGSPFKLGKMVSRYFTMIYWGWGEQEGIGAWMISRVVVGVTGARQFWGFGSAVLSTTELASLGTWVFPSPKKMSPLGGKSRWMVFLVSRVEHMLKRSLSWGGPFTEAPLLVPKKNFLGLIKVAPSTGYLILIDYDLEKDLGLPQKKMYTISRTQSLDPQ